MGKKKSFIDKKSAVTYSLIYRSTEDADAEPERVLVEADKGVGIGKPDLEVAAQQHAAHAASGRRYPPGHPLAWLEDEAAGRQGELSEERRRELLELGFPDDGYDYLRHMRTIGRGGASLEGVAGAAPASDGGAASGRGAGAAEPREEPGLAGPSIYVPAVEIAAPEEDVRLFDASRLTVLQPVEQEEEAAGLMGGVTAFSRQKRAAHGAVQREIAELDELMRQMEEEEVEEAGEEGTEGMGDLLDDFIITATEVDQAQGHSQVEGGEGSTASDLESYDPDGSDPESDYESGSEGGEERGQQGAAGRGGGSSRGPGRPGSIASTYWRDERQDRKELLAVIDERFEHLALEYDEDEIGEMDEQEEEIRGPATLNDFQGIINEFATSHTQSQRAYEDNVPYHAPGYRSVISEQLEHAGLSDDDAAVAVQKAHEALRRAEETPDERRIEQKAAVWVDDAAAQRERWDCESVLSLRSNLDNHPGKIQDPGRLRKGGTRLAGSGTAAKMVAQGMIKLGRHGIPMGVLPGKPTAAALRRLDERAAAEASAAAEAATEAQRAGSSSSDAEDGEEGSEEGAIAEQGAAVAAGQGRDKGETAEEKKARKAAVKEAKREARAAKKELKQMFKQESAKAQRRAATAQVQPALRLA